jgi:hypothetical protein
MNNRLIITPLSNSTSPGETRETDLRSNSAANFVAVGAAVDCHFNYATRNWFPRYEVKAIGVNRSAGQLCGSEWTLQQSGNCGTTLVEL